MPKRKIDPKVADLAASFYEPVYQRFQMPGGSEPKVLLCFVKPTRRPLRQLLANHGAAPSPTFRASCFSEVWEIKPPAEGVTPPASELRHLDQQICDSIGCLDSAYPSSAGSLLWNDVGTHWQNSRWSSRLLEESAKPRIRGRNG
jgi:hypothetical protein